MPRKASSQRAERTPIRPDRQSPHKGISLDGLSVKPITDETRSDAQRVVTFQHHRKAETPETIAASGVVFAALGLLPPRPATVATAGAPQALDFTCPFCDAPPRMRCHNDRGAERPTHADRKRLAERGEIPRPIPEKENTTDG